MRIDFVLRLRARPPHGVEFRFRTEVTSLETRSDAVTAVYAITERFSADRYIVAAASYSTPLLATRWRPSAGAAGEGVLPHVRRSTGKPSLTMPVVDDSLHAPSVRFRAQFAWRARRSSQASIKP